MATAVPHDLRHGPRRWVEQRARNHAAVPATAAEAAWREHALAWRWLSRWWDGLPEADKTILTGAGILAVPLTGAVTYCLARLLSTG